jgi:hypothetical protein
MHTDRSTKLKPSQFSPKAFSLRPKDTPTPSGHLPANLTENPEPEFLDYRSVPRPSAIYPKDVEPPE